MYLNKLFEFGLKKQYTLELNPLTSILCFPIFILFVYNISCRCMLLSFLYVMICLLLEMLLMGQ